MIHSNIIQWQRSEGEGFVTSKDNRFQVEPVYIGRTTPQYFRVVFHPGGMCGPAAVVVDSMAYTVREAKVSAQRFWDNKLTAANL